MAGSRDTREIDVFNKLGEKYAIDLANFIHGRFTLLPVTKRKYNSSKKETAIY